MVLNSFGNEFQILAAVQVKLCITDLVVFVQRIFLHFYKIFYMYVSINNFSFSCYQYAFLLVFARCRAIEFLLVFARCRAIEITFSCK